MPTSPARLYLGSEWMERESRNAGAVSFVFDPARPYSNVVALRRLLASLRGDTLWWEPHLPAKALEFLSEALDTKVVSRVRLLSGPANVTRRAKKDFGRFAEEMREHGVEAQWRVVPQSRTSSAHARVIFDDLSAYQLPPLNSILHGTLDEIVPTSLDRARYEELWHSTDGAYIGEVTPVEPKALDAHPGSEPRSKT